MSIFIADNVQSRTSSTAPPSMVGHITNSGVFINRTRIVTSAAASSNYFNFTYSKQGGTSTTLVIDAVIPAYNADNDLAAYFIDIDGTKKYTGIQANCNGANGSSSIQILQFWTGLASGSRTITFGHNTANATSNRPVNIINPNTSDDGRFSTGTVILIHEIQQ
jgi:hypothetical protein